MSNGGNRQTKKVSPDEVNRALASELHHALFPEEYDFYYDSSSEAKKRQRGVSPMSAAYIAKTDRRRESLGFAPFQMKAASSNTRAWVLQKIVGGQEDDLRNVVAAWAAENAVAAKTRDTEKKGHTNRRMTKGTSQ